ncbi:DUF6036 family nucleotidyltransferase [Neobacillus sp. SCS-31]|uniref:DUF6036 family nucleotidyltransferase n=1 Tax=Neobacillus oceani TaxID=3115292 RepID=UPI003906C937
MTQVEKGKLDLKQLANKTQFEKMVGVVAILTKIFQEQNLKPIIVGGLAVEIYTHSDYTTVDIDIVFSQWTLAKDVLSKLGFKQYGRHFFHEELHVSIEVPGDMLEDSDEDKVIKMNLPNGDFVYVIGIEDIILDRLRACKHWKSTSDCEWAKRLYLIHSETVDKDYLIQCAKRDQTNDLLLEWKL